MTLIKPLPARRMSEAVLDRGVQSTFQMEDMIALVADGLRLDVHNWYDFDGYHFRPSARTARFEWKRSPEFGPAETPGGLTIIFEGVSNIAVLRRDDEMPFTEDSCLSSFSFLDECLATEFGAWTGQAAAESDHADLGFQSGARIKVWAESVRHEITR